MVFEQSIKNYMLTGPPGCGKTTVTTVALEASGVYGHVLFLTLLEESFTVVMTSPSFTRQVKGRHS